MSDLHPDEVEAAVHQAWKDALDVDDVPPGTTFFDLGGRSRELVMVALAVEERFGVELSLRDLVQAPTAKGMVNLVLAVAGGR